MGKKVCQETITNSHNKKKTLGIRQRNINPGP